MSPSGRMSAVEPLRIGVLGAARIAGSAVVEPARTTGARLVAVAARDEGRAKAFAAEHGVERVLGSYADVVADPEVEAVYNPLANSLHGPWNLAAVEAGKHVLTEKPSASDATEAHDVRDAAVGAGVLVVEGFHYLYHPVARRLLNAAGSGELGELQRVEISMVMPPPPDGDPRWSLELAGGALMDVGCYPVNAARMLAGPVRAATASARWEDVDVTLAGVLDHEGGALSLISCSLLSGRHNVLQVIGSEGVIDVPTAFTPPKDKPSALYVTRGTGDLQELTFRPVDQYTAEAEGFAALVEAGPDADLPQMPLVESLDNATTIEHLLAAAR
jgi:predicted dehydrogenase